MITITQQVLNDIIAHGIHDLPNECCGYLAGNDGVITANYRMKNTDASPEHYTFDPEEQFKVLKTARSNGLKILANYHSHPETPSRPSEEDIRLAFDPNILYFILSLKDDVPVLKAFEIINNQVKNIPIQIV